MAMGDGLGCTYAFNIDEFCQNFKHFPIQADSALKILTRAGYLEYTDEQDNASRLIFTLNRDELYRIHENNGRYGKAPAYHPPFLYRLIHGLCLHQ